MIYVMKTYDEIKDVLKDGDICILVNCLHSVDTKIFEGLKNLVFIKSNLMNCDLPSNTQTYDCNTDKVIFEEINVPVDDDEVTI